MNKAVLFLLATTIGLGIISLHLVRTLRAEREQVSSLQAQIDRLQSARSQAAQRPLETPFGPVPDAAAASPFSTVSSATTPAASPPPPSMAASVSNPVPATQEMPSREVRMHFAQDAMKRQRALLKHPEYREAMRLQQKLMYAQTYPDLAQALDMTAGQVDQLTTLLADQALRSMENAQPWVGRPDQPQAQERMRKAQLQQQKNEAELANLLGPAKLQAWKEYQQSLGARHQVTQLRALLASKGMPLQEDLVNPLVKALAYEQQRLANEPAPDGGAGWAAWSAPGVYVGSTMHASPDPAGPTGQSREEFEQRQLERLTRYYGRLRDAAASVLSPQQLQVFEEQQNARLKMQQMQLRMMRVQAQGKDIAAGVSGIEVAVP